MQQQVPLYKSEGSPFSFQESLKTVIHFFFLQLEHSNYIYPIRKTKQIITGFHLTINHESIYKYSKKNIQISYKYSTYGSETQVVTAAF